MIKKHLNLPRLLQTERQLSAHIAMRHALKVQLTEKLNSYLSSASLLNVNLIDKKRSNGRHIAFSIMGLLLLSSIMLTSAQAASVVKSGQRVLMIEMSPALCGLQPSRARMRQCLEGYSLTVSGLDLGYAARCGRDSEPRLTPLQLKVVNRIMPDSTVRSQAWQHYGACSPLNASSYFRQIVTLADQLKLPSELNTGNSYTVSKSRFIKQVTRLNSGMTSSSIDLICQAGNRRQTILTDVHVCYDGSQFGSCRNVVDNCGANFIISGGK